MYQLYGLGAIPALALAAVIGALVSSVLWSYRPGHAQTPRRSSPSKEADQRGIQNATKGTQPDSSAVSLMQCVKRADPYDPSPRADYLSWDDYFMAVAFLSAGRSKDPNKQVYMRSVIHNYPKLCTCLAGFKAQSPATAPACAC